SRRVSPLVVDDAVPEMLTASAERRLAAISKLVRVRVDGSRKRLMTVRPRSVGTFLIGRSLISTKVSARDTICLMSSAESGSMPRRWGWANFIAVPSSRSAGLAPARLAALASGSRPSPAARDRPAPLALSCEPLPEHDPVGLAELAQHDPHRLRPRRLRAN